MLQAILGENTLSQTFRRALVNLEATEDRAKVRRYTAFLQPISAVTLAASVALAVSGLFLAHSGGLLFLIGAAGALISRDVYVISGNVYSILDGVVDRLKSLPKTSWLVTEVTKNTWVVKPCFHNALVELLNKPPKELNNAFFGD